MKFWFPTLALVATVSLPALAQEAPTPGDMPRPGDATMARPSTQQMEAMRALHTQMRQIHEQSRLTALGALTPAHRVALANIIGQLAIAPNPNRRAAEMQIDALLSPNEKNAVLSAEANERTGARSLMESARAQMEAAATPDERAKMQARDAARAQREAEGRQRMTAMTPDAGRTLLRYAAGGGERMGGPMGGRVGAFQGAPGADRPI